MAWTGAVILLVAMGATAQTNTLSDAEIQGRQLAMQLCDARPTENFTNTGVMKIRGARGTNGETSIKIQLYTGVTATNWVVCYKADWIRGWAWWESLVVIHQSAAPNNYHFQKDFGDSAEGKSLSGNQTILPFAGSDFWLCDLGLDFFHWPAQKILKKEIKRSRGCTVLESTNPNPSTNSYSRVVSWIDNESGGIVQAEAYDSKNKLLKEFAPKSFKKIKGQWELQELEIRNVQTGSRTRLDFDLKK